METLLNVRIDSAQELIWEGKVTSVSSVNSQGPFDILPFHAAFVTIIEKEPIFVRPPEGKVLKFNLTRALIYNHDNIVSIYTL